MDMPSGWIEYVVGFLFDETERYVTLIKKERPAWQKGRLNGVGGHIEKDEAPNDAMVREFKEETGVTIKHWNLLAILQGRDWVVWFYWQVDKKANDVRTMTDEEVRQYKVDDILWAHQLILPNLKVLIPLALDKSGIVKPVILIDKSDMEGFTI